MFARTERLLLRPGWVEDAPALAAAIGDEAILTNLATAPSPYRLADAESWLSTPRAEGEAVFVMIARTEGAPRLVGGIGLHRSGEDMELGYWVARPFWGLGFATEAGRAVIDIARHTLRHQRLVAGHFLDNPGSGNVLRKLGFRPTGDIVARHCKARQTMVPTRQFELDFAEEPSLGDTPDRRMMAA